MSGHSGAPEGWEERLLDAERVEAGTVTPHLRLERRSEADRTTTLGYGSASVSLTPAIDEDYWAYRVRLTATQAVVGFPKFGTVGIGFAVEEDGNTNLPYGIRTVDIVKHICHNAGDDTITVAQMCEAVDLIRRAAYEDHGGPGERTKTLTDWEYGEVQPYDLSEAERRVRQALAERAGELL